MPKVNPKILTWARETAGLTQEEAAWRLGFRDARKWTAVERLGSYEDGWGDPSRSVLVRMSKQYHRPLITFYLSEPPRKGDRGADFRTLPADRSATDDAILDALLRDAHARQRMVRAVLEDEEETEHLPFIGSHKISDGRQTILEYLRCLLDVNHTDYYAQPDADTAFDLLRDSTEQIGVFVLLKGNLGTYQTEIETEVFRGFSIADEIAPFVVINEYDARAAWSFTLLHELVHLVLGQTGIGNSRTENDTERFCDDVAGRFLLRDSDVKELALYRLSDTDELVEQLTEFASRRNLSRAMVAYRAHRIGEITQPTYERLSSVFRGQWIASRASRRERQRRTGGGGDFYVTRRHRNGNGLISLVRRMMADGALSTTKAATVLGVKSHQVQGLLELSQGR